MAIMQTLISRHWVTIVACLGVLVAVEILKRNSQITTIFEVGGFFLTVFAVLTIVRAYSRSASPPNPPD